LAEAISAVPKVPQSDPSLGGGDLRGAEGTANRS